VWAEAEGFDFPLLSDFWPHGAVSQAYGVFNERNGGANRGTFLIDPNGVIQFAELNGPGEPRDQNVWRAALAALAAGA
jgi:peroxiredoxin (alkyl hydroperoxide reductase subunit C)